MLPLALQPPPVLQEQLTPQAIQAKGEALEKMQKWDELADYFESLNPKDRRLFLTFWLKALQKAQRWERMVAVCTAAIPQLEGKGGPKLSLERMLKASAPSHLGRHEEALLAHQENGRLGSPESYRSACSEARLIPDWATEGASADALLALKPSDAEGLALKGEALAQLQQFQEAEPILRRALQADAKQPFAWSNLGRCLNERKAWTAALDALNQALALDPALPEAHYNRGRTNFELKQFKASTEDFRLALASNPSDSELKENLHQAERSLKAEGRGSRQR